MNSKEEIQIVPNGYTEVTPWIITKSTEKMIIFLQDVFGAEEIPNSRIVNDQNVIIHVVVKIGTTPVMLFDARQGWGPTPSFLNFYVADIEKAYAKALSLGAVSVTDITTLWFGERVCRILDPFGNLFWINERIKELDFTDPETAKIAQTPEAINGIQYIQQSLEEAMKTQYDMLRKQFSIG